MRVLKTLWGVAENSGTEGLSVVVSFIVIIIALHGRSNILVTSQCWLLAFWEPNRTLQPHIRHWSDLEQFWEYVHRPKQFSVKALQSCLLAILQIHKRWLYAPRCRSSRSSKRVLWCPVLSRESRELPLRPLRREVIWEFTLHFWYLSGMLSRLSRLSIVPFNVQVGTYFQQGVFSKYHSSDKRYIIKHFCTISG